MYGMILNFVKYIIFGKYRLYEFIYWFTYLFSKYVRGKYCVRIIRFWFYGVYL